MLPKLLFQTRKGFLSLTNRMFMPSQAVRPDKEKLEKNIALRRALTIVVTQRKYIKLICICLPKG